MYVDFVDLILSSALTTKFVRFLELTDDDERTSKKYGLKTLGYRLTLCLILIVIYLNTVIRYMLDRKGTLPKFQTTTSRQNIKYIKIYIEFVQGMRKRPEHESITHLYLLPMMRMRGT